MKGSAGERLLIAVTIWPALLADTAEVEIWTVNVPGVPGLLPEAGVPAAKVADSWPAAGGVGDELHRHAVQQRARRVAAPAVLACRMMSLLGWPKWM